MCGRAQALRGRRRLCGRADARHRAGAEGAGKTCLAAAADRQINGQATCRSFCHRRCLCCRARSPAGSQSADGCGFARVAQRASPGGVRGQRCAFIRNACECEEMDFRRRWRRRGGFGRRVGMDGLAWQGGRPRCTDHRNQHADRNRTRGAASASSRKRRIRRSIGRAGFADAAFPRRRLFRLWPEKWRRENELSAGGQRHRSVPGGAQARSRQRTRDARLAEDRRVLCERRTIGAEKRAVYRRRRAGRVGLARGSEKRRLAATQGAIGESRRRRG